MTPLCRSLELVITVLAALKIRSNFSTRKKDQSAKLGAFSQLENRRNSKVLTWTVIVITVKQYSNQWVVTTKSVPVKKLVPPYQIRMLNEVIKTERWMKRDGNI